MSVAALAELGSLLADQSRSTLLVALMDGRAWTVTELAHHATIARSTASEHLSRLHDAGLVVVEAQGRHRYFRLADNYVAQLVETLGGVQLSTPGSRRHFSKVPPALAHARSCYDHLAGQVAVELYEGLVTSGHLMLSVDLVTITVQGRGLFQSLGVDVSMLERSGRPLVRTCLDWTERRHHLAGGLGAALFQVLIDRRWIRRGRQPRSIVITEAGNCALPRLTGSDRTREDVQNNSALAEILRT